MSVRSALSCSWSTPLSIATACVVIVAGCGDGEHVPQVSGRVTFEGQPLDHGSLRFFGPDGRPIGSVIQPDGTYQAELPPGEYDVSITAPARPPAEAVDAERPMPPGASDFPAEYATTAESGLTATVEPGVATQQIDFELP